MASFLLIFLIILHILFLILYEKLWTGCCPAPKKGRIMKEYMTIKEASEKWGIGTRWINTLCHEGRIEGVVMFGASFAIPRDTEKPEDKRVKNGKYIKKKDERQ